MSVKWNKTVRLRGNIIHTYQTIAGSFRGCSSLSRWLPSKQSTTAAWITDSKSSISIKHCTISEQLMWKITEMQCLTLHDQFVEVEHCIINSNIRPSFKTWEYTGSIYNISRANTRDLIRRYSGVRSFHVFLISPISYSYPIFPNNITNSLPWSKQSHQSFIKDRLLASLWSGVRVNSATIF